MAATILDREEWMQEVRQKVRSHNAERRRAGYDVGSDRGLPRTAWSDRLVYFDLLGLAELDPLNFLFLANHARRVWMSTVFFTSANEQSRQIPLASTGSLFSNSSYWVSLEC